MQIGDNLHEMSNLVSFFIDNPYCTCGQLESSTHFFLQCNKYNLQRQRYLAVIPYQLTLSLLLHGIPGESAAVNDTIFKQVQLYVTSTRRFVFINNDAH